MTHRNAGRVAGPLGAIGGLLWAGGWMAIAAGSDDIWFILLLSVGCLTGSLVTIAADSDMPGDPMRVASALFGVLSVILVLGGLMTGGTWWLGVGGAFSAVVATVLLGLSMLLTTRASRGVGWGLLVASLLVLPTNSENWQVWLAVPFGFAWVVAGYALWSHESNRLTLAP